MPRRIGTARHTEARSIRNRAAASDHGIGRGVREKKMLREAPSYLTACGLAMRRFLR